MDGEARKYRDEVYENEGWWFALETYSRDYQSYYLREGGGDAGEAAAEAD